MVLRKKLDTTRMNQLGWKAKTNLNEGLKKQLVHSEKIILKLLNFQK